MSQYKILVRNAEEVEKAQTLFEKLGFRKGECTTYDLPKLIVAQTNEPYFGTYSSGASLTFDCKNKYEWLSMEQLEDLVNNKEHLISGVEALKHITEGIVQYKCDNDPDRDRWTTITDHFWDQYDLGVFLNKDTTWKFRFKPQTVKLEIEVPAPFEPKVGDTVFIPANFIQQGYIECKYPTFDDVVYQFGAWRTEDEIKIVVEQLRKLGALK